MTTPDWLFSRCRDRLPVLGVGASLSFQSDPDPVDLAGMRGGPAFVEYAGTVQHTYMGPQLNALRSSGIPLLYHPSCLNLCGPDRNPVPWLEAVKEHVEAVDSVWLAQDVAVCFVGSQPGYSIHLGYFVGPLLTPEALDEAVERVEEVLAVVRRPLLLEPAPVTFHAGTMHPMDWLGALSERTDCGLLLDAGHLLSHALVLGLDDPTDLLDRLDLSRVIEVHVAGGVLVEGPLYLDAHELPILPQTWDLLETLLERCPNLRAVCVECEGTLAGAVLPVLEAVRREVAARSANPALRERAVQELRGAP